MEALDYTNLDFNAIKQSGFIGYLDTQGYLENAVYNHPIYQDLIKYNNIYESFKDSHCISEYGAVIVPMSIDEIFLYKHKNIIKTYLKNGGIVISFAQNFLKWLPGNNLYKQSETPIRIREVLGTEHTICKGVSNYDLNYKRGVKGFFNRGYFIAPKDAEVFLKDSDGQCVGYIDTQTTNGVILSTAGADLMWFGHGFDNTTSRRLGINLLLWLNDLLANRALKRKAS